MNRLRPLVAIAALLALGACDTWFGEQEGAPLPGERISVLAHERVLTPDPGTENAEILLPRPSPNLAWPQAGGYANHAMHHIQIPEVIKRVWDADIGSSADDEMRYVATPVVAAGKVFTIDSETVVRAFDEKTGDTLWSAELTPDEEDDEHITGGLAFDQGRLFVTTGFAQVIALDPANGAELWRVDVGAPMRSAPTVRGGRVFAVTLDNRLHVLAASDGRSLWKHEGVSEVASLLGGASPAVDQGVVVVPYSSGELVGLKVDTGQVLWSVALGAAQRTDEVATLSHIRGRPVIDRGRVFAISNSEVMTSLDLLTGRRIWEKRVGGIESPWVAGDYLYVLATDSELVCLSRDDGRIFWVSSLPRFEDPEDMIDPIVWTGPVLVSDRLLVAGSQGEAMAVSPYTGTILGVQEMPDRVSVEPVVANGTVFFLSDNAELSAYR